MVHCTNCLRVFRNNWTLERHLMRVRPCISHLDSTQNTQKATLDTQKATLDTQKATCKYCNDYSSKINLKRHEQTCRFRDDPVRQLELKNCVSPKVTPDCKTECRYCNKNLNRTSLLNRHYLVCEAKERYRQELLSPQKGILVNNGIINNNTNTNTNTNNGIINNNIILNLGNENMDHVKTEQILKLLGNIKKNNPDDSLYVMAGDLLLSFDDYICENPQNKNVVIGNIKSSYGEVKTDNGWKKMSVTKCLDSSLKNTAKLLTDQRSDMELQVGGFKNPTTKGIFSEVRQFACKGLKHSTHDNREMGELKNSLKINKLRDRLAIEL